MFATLVFLLVGCGLGECEDLCAARADCLEGEIADAGTTWDEWTGYGSRAAFHDACLGQFQDSLDAGTERSDLQDLCEAEQEEVCPAD